jgi:hypothetical protein
MKMFGGLEIVGIRFGVYVGNRELTALTIPRVFFVIKVDCRKCRVLNNEEVRITETK